MRFTLIICTYKRPQPLLTLLESVKIQQLYPDHILIIDGSPDGRTKQIFDIQSFKGLVYYKVPPEHRGLTKQRNYGIARVADDQDIVCFLDDDTVLDKDYFSHLIDGFYQLPDAVGIGGIATNQNRWKKNIKKLPSTNTIYTLDDYYIEESLRNKVRNLLRLQSPLPPGQMPNFSHGRTYAYPLNGKRYPVDLIVGMSMAFRTHIFKEISFSSYFEGYGLYEDADFCLRARRYGKLYYDTNVRLKHYHAPDGRPNKFTYGKMVIRNGWYVWRTRYPKPIIKARLKWNATAAVLTGIRLTNALRGNAKMAAFTESMGRIWGWWSLLFNKPRRV